jgi:branched-chain amino acid transport system substrate-binding protein
MNDARMIGVSAISLAAAIVLIGPGTAFAADKEPIIIGAAIAQSGFIAPYDTDPAKAAEMAIEDVNHKGGVFDRPLKMLYRDTKSDIAGGGVAAQELLDAGAKVILVTGDFDFGGAAARAANAHDTLAIAPFAADPKFGVRGIGPYAFSFSTASDTIGFALAEFAHKKGWKTAYELNETNIQYDKSVSAAFDARFKELNGPNSVVGTDVFVMDDANIAAQITRLKALPKPPDVLLLSAFTPAGPSALRQIRAAGIDIPVISAEDMDGDYWADAVPHLSNFYNAAMGSIYGDDSDGGVNDFIAHFKDKYGNHPSTAHTLTGYSVIQGLTRAMERGKSIESSIVKAELEKFNKEPLLVGPTTFNRDIHITFDRPVTIVETKDGAHHFVDKVQLAKVPTAH